MVRGPCDCLRKLQKGREIIDFTAFSGGPDGIRTHDRGGVVDPQMVVRSSGNFLRL